MAYYSWNPVDKFSYIKQAHKLINQTVMDDVLNIAIRFLRIYMLMHAPDFIGIAKHIQEDRSIIIENIHLPEGSGLEGQIKQYIFDYLTSAGIISQEEILA